jgi:hypothetical protein
MITPQYAANPDDKLQRTILSDVAPISLTIFVGRETGSLVTTDYGGQGNRFSGDVSWMEIDLDKAAADADHIIKPEERVALALAI